MTPEAGQALFREATDFHKAQDFEAAITLYRQLLDTGAETAETLTYLASALRSAGRQPEAVEVYRRLEPLAADRADVWFNRGNALNDIGRHAEASDCYSRALDIEPDNASVISNLAIALAELGREEEAAALYRRALELDPGQKLAAHNLANLLSDWGELDEAAALLRQIVAKWPELAEGHYNLGHVLLKLGDYANGFAEYEWRWDTPGFFKKPDYKGIPVWRGEPLAGRKLIVHSEQGLGDTIQFAKLLGLAKSLGGDIVFHVPEKLEALLKSLPFDIEVTSQHSASGGDFQIPLMSLMNRLKLTPGSIPVMQSHLAADTEKVAQWRQRLHLGGSEKAIGFVWQGNPNSPAERGRSLKSPEELAPFSALSGTRLIALQKLGPDDLEPADTPSGWRVKGLSFSMEHPGADMDDGADAFLDTAAIMSGLDLVVSVCTAPLHLSGALGRPAIALLRSAPDWRWMMRGEDTPWYPTVTLCRRKPGEAYAPAIARAVEKARDLLTQ
ncbi:tetratricopeptide repeat protein [Rhizobium sp. LjRoot254]|uniref:tetratricopeptide repeat protein n=1 Tax=Rhizobium sp. LjRoot254 TaxID=3342297 RepID=UPI003ECF27DB